MPLYQFYNKRTKKSFELQLTLANREEYLKTHKHITQELTPTHIVSGVDGVRKVDGGFKDLLKTIKKNNIRSNINTDV